MSVKKKPIAKIRQETSLKSMDVLKEEIKMEQPKKEKITYITLLKKIWGDKGIFKKYDKEAK